MDVGFSYNYNKQNQRFFDILDEFRGLLLPIKGYENMELVSLEEAIIPLVSILPNIHTYVYMAKDNCSIPPADNLSLDESASICLYSIEWEPHDECLCYVLNKTLRLKDRQKLIPWYLYLKLILIALNKLPSINNKIIYRGIKYDLSKDYSEGKTFIWWAFSSCTSSLSVLESIKFIGKTGVRTMFIINCNSAKNISKHTYFPSEEEVLIFPATRFVVVSYENPSNDLHIIHLKEILPPFTLLEPVDISDSSTSIKSNLFKNRRSVPVINEIFERRRVSIDQNTIYLNSKLEQIILKNEFSSSMNLSEQQLCDQDIPMIIEQVITNNQCKILDLTSNEITPEGAILLANALNNNLILKELILYNNHIGDKGVRALTLELSINNSTLKTLNLGLNDLSDDSAEHLAQMFKINQTLKHLYLQENNISDRGIQILANVLARQNWSLELLDLSSNKLLTDLSISSIIDMLELNQSIQKLIINDCNLTESSEIKLKEFIKSKKDFQLII